MKKLKWLIIPLMLLLTACGMSDTEKQQTMQYMHEYEDYLRESYKLASGTEILRLSWKSTPKDIALIWHNSVADSYYELPKNKHTEKFHHELGLYNVVQQQAYEMLHELEYDPQPITEDKIENLRKQSQKHIENLKVEQAKIFKKVGLSIDN